MMEITFYDVGTNVAYSPYAAPGGDGSYANPITLATALAEIPLNGIVYVKGINKYFIHGDLCVQCTTDWANQKYHIDLWVGAGNDACAVQFGVMHLPVIINPAGNLPVSSQPLSSSNPCFTFPSPLPTS